MADSQVGCQGRRDSVPKNIYIWVQTPVLFFKDINDDCQNLTNTESGILIRCNLSETVQILVFGEYFMEFTRFVDLIFGTSVHNYRRLSSIWWRLSAGWVLSHRFALRSRPALAVLKSDQDQEMGVGLGGHGRGWVRAASAGRQLRRDQS